MTRDPRRIHDPVRIPGPAAVERERLLPLEGVVVDHGPLVANAYVHALEDVVALETTDPVVLEAADHRLVQQAAAIRRGPPDPPEPGLRLEQAEGEALEPGPTGKVGRVVGVAVTESGDDRARLRPRVELDPLVVERDERVDALAVRDLPGPEEEVEIVPSVVLSHSPAPCVD